MKDEGFCWNDPGLPRIYRANAELFNCLPRDGNSLNVVSWLHDFLAVFDEMNINIQDVSVISSASEINRQQREKQKGMFKHLAFGREPRRVVSEQGTLRAWILPYIPGLALCNKGMSGKSFNKGGLPTMLQWREREKFYLANIISPPTCHPAELFWQVKSLLGSDSKTLKSGSLSHLLRDVC